MIETDYLKDFSVLYSSSKGNFCTYQSVLVMACRNAPFFSQSIYVYWAMCGVKRSTAVLITMVKISPFQNMDMYILFHMNLKLNIYRKICKSKGKTGVDNANDNDPDYSPGSSCTILLTQIVKSRMKKRKFLVFKYRSIYISWQSLLFFGINSKLTVCGEKSNGCLLALSHSLYQEPVIFSYFRG